MTRSETRRPAPTLAPILLLTLALADPGRLAAAAAPPPPPAPPVLRPAPPPTPLESARVRRWQDLWQDEASALLRAFGDATRTVEAGADGSLRPRCVALAGALLSLDRRRVLPVPDRAADFHLRRALHHLARAAVTCLTERPYAARHSLSRASDSFSQARRVLRRYRRAPAPRSTAPEPASSPR